ncbi:SDR family oxidoreductase [Pontibacter sp. G13]|uniref:SDR family oxidoreductase n=1 Tax=Pontibacter sp. G13 TaxID=3074898 RepID=UPI00288A7492|nr:SDR family oxidoreductase [Pontibacter sp. G13]WNJ16147.1 SDR family oxidoreductase [Pontibacter sp. G13]
MNLDLQHKNALVCGSTQGIGRATAIELAQMGATVTLLARNEAALKTVLGTLATDHGQQHDYLVADFSQPVQVGQTVQDYLSQTQKIFHILINNTGGPPGGPIADATLEAFMAAYQMHLACNHVLAQAMIPGMKEASFGRIINVISTSVKQPINGLGVSNTTRGAVANWSKTLANEIGQFGITVNNVLPGFTETERLFSIIRNRAEKTGKTEQEVADAMKLTTPAHRFAQPEEVANAIAFLAAPAAGYINGINVPVDGGRTKSL